MAYDFDMTVIGAGAAGLTTAALCALFGARTALVEGHRLGGECTWSGCVPSKSLLHAAHTAQVVRSAALVGVDAGELTVDFGRVMERVRGVRERICREADAPPNLEKLGVAVIEAQARFVDAHTVELADSKGATRRVTSRLFAIATGTSPRLPFTPGLAEVPPLTNETLFELRERPGHLLVLGTGPVGIEMAQAFRRLGSEVTVVGRGEEILSRDDREQAAELRQCLADEGVRFLLKDELASVTQREGGVKAETKGGQRLEATHVLAAAGRQPNLAKLNLAAAGVRVTERGVPVDSRCRTNVGHIYAAGDIAGLHQFTHTAEHMGKVIASNAILHLPTKRDDRHVVWCTFTDPELARLGASEEELTKEGVAHTALRFGYSQLDRAITEGEQVGQVKVLADRRGRVLGASILGTRAGEMIAEFALAMRHGLTLDQVSGTIHPYPTYALANRRAADHWALRRRTRTVVKVVQTVFGFRGEYREYP